MSTDSCPRNEQALAWALHALEPDEEMEVLLHLPQCASCQAAVQDAEDVLSHLGAAVEQTDPPPSLRDSILAAAAEAPQRPVLTPRTSPEGIPAQVPGPRRPTTLSRPSSCSGSRAQGRSWLSRRRFVAASVALVAAIAVGGLAIRNSQLEQERDAQAQSITALLQQLDQPGAKYALLATSDGSTVAAVLVSAGQRRVFTVGMPANAADRTTYVLWGIPAGGAPQALGAFDVGAADAGQHTVGSGAEADGFATYAISLEPGRIPPAAPSSVMAQGQVEI